MWLIGARDLQFRRRRVLIAVLATSVVFAMTLLMAGMSKGLDDEIDRLVGSFKAETWAVARGASGPFTTTKFLSAEDQERVSDADGVRAAAPVIVGRGTIGTKDLTNVNLLGTPSKGFGAPEITEGRAARTDGEIVVDDHLDVSIGDRLDVSGLPARVVGKSGDSRYNFGVNTVYLTLDDARALTFAGEDLASTVIMRGRPSAPMSGVAVLTNDDVAADQARTLASGKSTIDLIQVLLWFVAAGIIALMVYLTALERVRDFAVLKATGSSNGTLFGALLLQAVVLSLGAALVAAVLTILLVPLVPFAVVISTTTYLILAVVAIVLGAIASLAGLRRAIGVDPAIAFGGRVMPDLTVRDLTMEFSSGGYAVRPIDGLDLDVTSGSLVLLLGASGCGKTTLLSMLARLLTPTSGTIQFGDIDITQLSGHELARYRRNTVGIVFQAFNLIPSLTARENVQVALQAGKVPRRQAKERATALLDRVGLTERASHRPADMSGGQQQRVAIARALAHDPPLVLADEPTAHLDYIQVDGVLRLLRDLAAPGRVVVVATHDERLLPLADHVVELTPRAAGDAIEPVTVELAAGELLFNQGDHGDLVYIVESGVVELYRIRDDQSEERLRDIESGGYFGELAPMFGLRRSASARAGAQPAVLTGMGLRDFRGRMGWSPTAGAADLDAPA